MKFIIFTFWLSLQLTNCLLEKKNIHALYKGEAFCMRHKVYWILRSNVKLNCLWINSSYEFWTILIIKMFFYQNIHNIPFVFNWMLSCLNCCRLYLASSWSMAIPWRRSAMQFLLSFACSNSSHTFLYCIPPSLIIP